MQRGLLSTRNGLLIDADLSLLERGNSLLRTWETEQGMDGFVDRQPDSKGGNLALRVHEATCDAARAGLIADSKEIDPNDKRVRIDTRKWAMGKLKPKKYGDRVTHAGDDDNPVVVENNHNVFGELLKAIKMERQAKVYGGK